MTRRKWPTDAVMIVCATPNAAARDRMESVHRCRCRDCGRDLVVDGATLRRAEQDDSTRGRPIKYFCRECLLNYELPEEIIGKDGSRTAKNAMLAKACVGGLEAMEPATIELAGEEVFALAGLIEIAGLVDRQLGSTMAVQRARGKLRGLLPEPFLRIVDTTTKRFAATHLRDQVRRMLQEAATDAPSAN